MGSAEATDRVRVYARVRPASLRDGPAVVSASEDRRTLIFGKGCNPAGGNLEAEGLEGAGAPSHGATAGGRAAAGRTFEYDRVFGGDTTQAEVFDELGAPLLADVLAGYDACALAYGQTGAGKTHSLLATGDKDKDGAGAGLLPRLAAGLFVGVECDPRHVYSVSVSMCQIYCEQIDDLLKPKNTNMRLVQTHDAEGGGGWEVKGLSWYECKSADFLLSVIRNGQRRITYAETSLNKHSSRAHAVIQLRVTRRRRMAAKQGKNLQASLERQDSAKRAVRATRGRLTVVDLAGSERVKRSLAEGARMREAQNINTSLFAFGKVVNALATRAPHVPFRDSVLTRLLEDRMRGNCNTRMLVCVSPSAASAGESLGTAEFAARAMRIAVDASVNETEMLVDARDLVGDLAVGMLRDSMAAASDAEISQLEAALADEEAKRMGAEARLQMEARALREACEEVMAHEQEAAIASERAHKAEAAAAEALRLAQDAATDAQDAKRDADEATHAADEARAECAQWKLRAEGAERERGEALRSAASAEVGADTLREECAALRASVLREKERSSALEAALARSAEATSRAHEQLARAREVSAAGAEAAQEELSLVHAELEHSRSDAAGALESARAERRRADVAEATAGELAREARAAHVDLRQAAAECAATANALRAARRSASEAADKVRRAEIALEQAYDAAGEAEQGTIDALKAELAGAQLEVRRLEQRATEEEEAYAVARARITSLVHDLSREGFEYRAKVSGDAAAAKRSLDATRGRVVDLEETLAGAEAIRNALRTSATGAEAQAAMWRSAAVAAAHSGVLTSKHCRDGKQRLRVVRIVPGDGAADGCDGARVEWASVGPFKRGVGLSEAAVLPEAAEAAGADPHSPRASSALVRLSTASRLLELDFGAPACAAVAHAALEALGVASLVGEPQLTPDSAASAGLRSAPWAPPAHEPGSPAGAPPADVSVIGAEAKATAAAMLAPPIHVSPCKAG